MKFLALLFSFLILHFVMAQDKEMYRVSPHWKVGDKKKVHTETITKVIYDDSLVSQKRESFDMEIKVISVQKEFVISFSSSNPMLSVLDTDVTFPNSVALKINSILKEGESLILRQNFEIQVDKSTAKPILIKNGLEEATKIKHEMRKKLRTHLTNTGRTVEESRNSEVDFGKQFDAMYLKVEQALLQKVDYIFSAYSISFPLNDKKFENIKTHDITAASKSDTLFPAVFSIESVEVNDKLILKTSVDYDKEFLLSQLKKSYQSLEKVTSNQVSILEREEIIIDLNSTWILSSVRNLHFEIPGMKTISKSVLTFL